MNFKKNFKRFFTLSRSAEGFTLVELIVVIAILGILVGVGMPAYGSYVESANKGVDRNNLAIVNNAFAIACIEHGVDPATGVSAAVLAWNSKTVTGLSSVTLVTKSGASTTNQDIITSFAANLGSGVEFKIHTSSDITFSNGKFVSSKLGAEGGNGGSGNSGVVDNGDGTYTINYQLPGGITLPITVDKATADKLKNNTFADDETLGADVLLDKVDKVASVAEILMDSSTSVISKLIYGSDNAETYLKNLATSLNMDRNSTEFMELIYAFDENDDPYLNPSVMANSLILTAAQKTTSEDFSTDFLTDLDIEELKGELNDPTTATDAMAKLALTYGMYTSYCAATGAENKSDEILASNSFNGMADLLAAVESQDFKDYLADDAGKADLNAYMASMQIINDATSGNNTDAAKDILSNGVNSDQLSDLLGSLMSSAE